MINAGSVYSELILNGDKYFSTLDKADKEMKSFENKLDNYGQKREKIGRSWTKKVSLPLIGVGAAALKVGVDFQSSMSEVQAISGATGEDLEALEEKAKEMGATTKFSASEAAEALKYMSMAGWDTNQMLDGLDGVMNLAAASGEELGLVSDIVTDALTAFGMEAKQASEFADLLASASSNSNTNVGMMGESFKYVAPLFGSLGYSAEDAALALGLMANAGIKGSQSGTSLRAAITRLVSPTKESAALIEELGINLTDAEGKMLPFKDIMDQLRYSFSDLTEEQQAQYASAIFGQQAMSGMLAIINASETDYNKLTKATKDYNGAAKEMADVMQDNLKGQLTTLKSQLEGVGIQIAETLIPIISKVVDKISEWVDWFANLDEGTQKTILKLGGLAIAAGPLLNIGGKFLRGGSSIIGILGKISGGVGTTTTAVAGMGTQMTLAGAAAKAGALLFNPWTLGIGAAGIAAVGLAKYLKQDAIPAVEIFNDEVSENTKEVVGSFLDMEKNVTASLNQLAWSGAEVTEEMADDIVGNFEQMKNDVINELEQQKEEALRSLEEMFANSISMTEEEKEEMIRLTSEKYDEQIKETEKGHERITEIFEEAKENNREITEEEWEEIIKIKEDMKEDSIRLLSETQEESETILKNLKNNAGTLTAEMAAETVRNSLEQKEQAIANAEEEYQERLRYAATLKADGSKESEELANKVIEEAKRQKDEAIAAAEEMHEKVVEEAKKQAEEHVEQIDWENGQLKSKWEELKEWFVNNPIVRKIKEIREENSMGTAWSGMKDIGQNAHGTNYWRGGLTWVGEQGPELIELPKGSKVYSNKESMAMMSGDSIVNNYFNISEMIIRNDNDIKRVAQELYNLQQKNSRSKGLKLL